MPDKFNRPEDPKQALCHDALCGNVELIKNALNEIPVVILGNPVVNAGWSHDGRRCGAQDDVIECLYLLARGGAAFYQLGGSVYDSAFRAFPRAAAFLFLLGAKADQANEEDGTTGLHAMAKIGFRSAAQVLLQHGADLEAKNSAGDTALDIATKENYPHMIKLLQDGELVASDTSIGTGEVVWYCADRGQGYLRDYTFGEQGVVGELFFDREGIKGDEPEVIEEGARLNFEITQDEFGLLANDVQFC